jgi:diguanylate cyclase (GGDEF)-like protein
MKSNNKRFRSEYRIQHKEGSYRWMLTRGFALRDATGEVFRMAGSQTDVTDRKLCDPLTGLPNRALFMDRLERALQDLHQDATHSFAVLALFSQSFKKVNDSLGYQVGDSLLYEFIDRLKSCLKRQDTVVSLGENGFAILLENQGGKEESTGVAVRLQEAMKRPFIIADEEVSTRLAVGIALGESGYGKPEDVLRDAQTAAQLAQENGQDYEVFDSQMRVQAVSRLRLESRLRQALEQKEFLLYYQPIVSLRDGRLVGFEALVRWQPEPGKIVGPDEFIPSAEETGLIVPLERYVLKEASRQIRVWQQLGGDPDLALSVNFSAEQYRQPDLVETLQKNLLETDLNPKTLRLEITESTFLKDSEALNELLTAIRKINIQLHMDDFGTGYSSLSYLHRFPISVLKIDRSFVSNMEKNAQTRQIVEAITKLGQNLRLGVTAEGIETLQQVLALKALKCDYGQGFYFSRPVAPDGAEALVRGELPWKALFEEKPEVPVIDSSDPGHPTLRDPH